MSVYLNNDYLERNSRIRWFVFNQKKMYTMVLVITEATRREHGTLTFVASNEIGMASCSVEIGVLRVQTPVEAPPAAEDGSVIAEPIAKRRRSSRNAGGGSLVKSPDENEQAAISKLLVSSRVKALEKHHPVGNLESSPPPNDVHFENGLDEELSVMKEIL